MDLCKTENRLGGRAWIVVLAFVTGCISFATSASRAEDVQDALGRFEKSDQGWKARMESMVRIARSGPEALPVLVDRLKDGPPAVRELSAQALAVLADPLSRPALVAALGDPSPDVRVYAIRGLTTLDSDPATAALFYRVLEQDASWAVRHAAAWGLERDDAGAASIGPALSAYDLNQMDTARLDEAAPEFALTDVLGKTHRLRDLRGRKSVLLKFYQEPL
jgi:HEAT repeats